MIRIEKGKSKRKTNLVTLLKVENVKGGKLGTEPSSVELVKDSDRKKIKIKEINSSIISEVFRYHNVPKVLWGGN